MEIKYTSAWMAESFSTFLGGDFVSRGHLFAFPYIHMENLDTQQSASLFGSISTQTIAQRT